MTNKIIESAVYAAREYGESFLGDVCFDVVRDSKRVQKYLRDNAIEDVVLYHSENGWFMVSVW